MAAICTSRQWRRCNPQGEGVAVTAAAAAAAAARTLKLAALTPRPRSGSAGMAMGTSTEDAPSTPSTPSTPPAAFECPTPRSGHVAVLGPPPAGTDMAPHMWVYGGYTNEGGLQRVFRELFCYHTLRDTWQRVETCGAPPMATCSQSAVAVGSRIFFFGGTSVPFGRQNSNELSVLDLHTLTWSVVEPRTEVCPLTRFGQTLSYDGKRNRLYVFGGTDGMEFYNDLWFFDLDAEVWHQVDTAADPHAPPAIYKHEVVVYKDQMVVIGGGAPFPAEGSCLRDLNVFDLRTLKWRRVSCKGPTVPAGRRSHACEVYGSAAYISGGITTTAVMDDFWRLDLESFTWLNIGASLGGTPPGPAYFHTLVCTGTGRMIKFGGVLDLQSRQRTNDLHVIDACHRKVPSLTQLCCEYLAQHRIYNPLELVYSSVPEFLVDMVLPFVPPSDDKFCAA